MILNDSYGYNKYCGGGITQAGITDVMWGYIKGLDWESVYPYLSMFQKDEDIDE